MYVYVYMYIHIYTLYIHIFIYVYIYIIYIYIHVYKIGSYVYHILYHYTRLVVYNGPIVVHLRGAERRNTVEGRKVKGHMSRSYVM